MPYINQRQREVMAAGAKPSSAGELNYFITKAILAYLERQEMRGWKGYGAYNEVLGVLEAVKLELYRRLVSAYEDMKIHENGDVYHD